VAEARRHERGFVDTSVVIDLDHLEASSLPVVIAVSAITVAELGAGPHAADDSDERARRQDRLQRADATFDPLPSTRSRLARTGVSTPRSSLADAKRRGRDRSICSSPRPPSRPRFRSTRGTAVTFRVLKSCWRSWRSDPVPVFGDALTGSAPECSGMLTQWDSDNFGLRLKYLRVGRRYRVARWTSFGQYGRERRGRNFASVKREMRTPHIELDRQREE
jgi:hypothetical protein